MEVSKRGNMRILTVSPQQVACEESSCLLVSSTVLDSALPIESAALEASP